MTDYDPCRTKGDDKCAMKLTGFVDYQDRKGRRTGGQLWSCVTCGRTVDARGNVLREGGSDGQDATAVSQVPGQGTAQ